MRSSAAHRRAAAAAAERLVPVRRSAQRGSELRASTSRFCGRDCDGGVLVVEWAEGEGAMGCWAPVARTLHTRPHRGRRSRNSVDFRQNCVRRQFWQKGLKGKRDHGPYWRRWRGGRVSKVRHCNVFLVEFVKNKNFFSWTTFSQISLNRIILWVLLRACNLWWKLRKNMRNYDKWHYKHCAHVPYRKQKLVQRQVGFRLNITGWSPKQIA